MSSFYQNIDQAFKIRFRGLFKIHRTTALMKRYRDSMKFSNDAEKLQLIYWYLKSLVEMRA